MLFVALDLNLDKLQDVLHVVKVVSLVKELFFYVLDSLPVFLIEVLEGIDQVYILECDKRLLEHAEIEHLNLLQR